jgi:hypothetical protein
MSDEVLTITIKKTNNSPDRNPDKPEPKRLLFTAEYAEYAERFFVFFYELFYSATSALSAVKKIFCQKMAEYHDKVTFRLYWLKYCFFNSILISLFPLWPVKGTNI